MEITTNHQWRNLLCGYELTDTELAQFDYFEPEEIAEHNFFRYLGYTYCLADFTRVDPNDSLALLGWYGIHADSVWGGVLVTISEDGEQVKVAYAYGG